MPSWGRFWIRLFGEGGPSKCAACAPDLSVRSRLVRSIWLLLLLLLPATASAQCAAFESCGCQGRPTWAAAVRWDAVDGGVVPVIESFSSSESLDGGFDIREFIPEGVAGAHLIFTTWARYPINADGGVPCHGVTFSAASWPAAIVDRTCSAKLEKAGIRGPPCRDTGCGCSSSGLGFTGLAGALLLRRKRRIGTRD